MDVAAVPSSFLALASVLLVSAVSFVGILFVGRHDHGMEQKLFLFISFAIGALLGDVFIHILPDIAAEGGDAFPVASLIVVGGILGSFVLEKFIHWRHCHTVDCSDHVHPLGMVSLVGDAAHNVVDGILIASSYLVSVPTGLATTVAVILHEIPQEVGDYAILLHSGYTRRRALFLNFLTGLTALGGALLVLLLHASLSDVERYLLPLVAGNFLYIAVADLLPELHKQTKIAHSLLQFIGVLLGIMLMFLLTFLE